MDPKAKKLIVALSGALLAGVAYRGLSRASRRLPRAGSAALMSTASSLRAPVAKKVPHTLTIGTTQFEDPYFWLRDDKRENPEVLKHLEAENRYTEAMMSHTEPLQKTLYNEFLSHLKEDDVELPYPSGDYVYYTKSIKGKNYPVYCRMRRAAGEIEPLAEAKEEVLLDVNQLAEGHEFFSLGCFRPSPDHRLLAYSFDTTGYETYEVRIKDLDADMLLNDRIPETAGDVIWGADNNVMYYTTMDAAHRPYKLWRHRLGADFERDTQLYTENDELFWLDISKSESGRFLFICPGGKVTSEAWYLDLHNPKAQLTLIEPRERNVLYEPYHVGDHFWFITNDKAHNFRLTYAPIATPGKAHWEEVVPYDQEHKLDHLQVFKDHVVLFGRKNGLEHVQVLQLSTSPSSASPTLVTRSLSPPSLLPPLPLSISDSAEAAMATLHPPGSLLQKRRESRSGSLAPSSPALKPTTLSAASVSPSSSASASASVSASASASATVVVEPVVVAETGHLEEKTPSSSSSFDTALPRVTSVASLSSASASASSSSPPPAPLYSSLITSIRDLAFPETLYSVACSVNKEFESPFVRLSYSSLVTPPSIYDYHFATNEMVLRKEKETPNYYRSLYDYERVWAVADDGMRVPMSIVYRKDKRLPKDNKMLLTAYGSYGICEEPEFCANWLPLLDRGVMVAIAHIRGGGEMGRHWYDLGKFLNKKNTFNDFITCAKHLIDTGYTSPSNLAISGGSAGGLLMGAVINARPDLFKAVVAAVPFVDVMATMSDPTIPLTVVEWEEWGNPMQKPYFDYMLSYSPYNNVKAQNYPAMLVTTGLNDSRVAYWEPAKWVCKLRDFKTDENPLLLKCKMGAGHGGGSGRYERLEERSVEYAFMLDQLGIKE